MEKERRVKALAIVVLVIAVLGLTIAFAALSQTLTINGSAYLNATKWGIKFENLSSPIKVGDATVTGEAKINESTYVEIANMNVNLKTPGDSVTYNVELVNEGTINAKIEKIEKTVLTEEQAKYLSFKVIKEDGQELNEGYILGKETRIPLTIKIEFKKDITKEDLPKEAITIELSYALTFVQTDETATSVGQTPSSACTTFDKKDTYQVGDEIALCNNDTNKSEDFYVISDNGDTVTALAKYNLLVGNIYETSTSKSTEISTEIEGYGLQNSSARGYLSDNATWTGTIAFAEMKDNSSNKGYWVDPNGNLLSKYGTSYPVWVFDSNSLLWQPVQSYQTYLRGLGYSDVTVTLPSYNDMTTLGCVGSSEYSCGNAPSWVYSTSYWLGSAYNNRFVWGVDSPGGFVSNHFTNYYLLGLRPVINVLKSDE